MSTYVCKWQAFENFEFINFRPKEKRIRKRQLNQRICERQHDNGKTGRSQWKNCCYWLILKKTALTNIFCILYIYRGVFTYTLIYIYCIYFQEMWIFRILSIYLFSQMPFKRKFCVSNFVKSTKIRKIREKIHTRKLVHFRKTFPEFQSDVIIKN